MENEILEIIPEIVEEPIIEGEPEIELPIIDEGVVDKGEE